MESKGCTSNLSGYTVSCATVLKCGNKNGVIKSRLAHSVAALFCSVCCVTAGWLETSEKSDKYL